MATNAGWPTRPRRSRRAAARRAGRDRRRTRPRLISRLIHRSPHRRRKSGTRLRHLRPMRCGHIPGERENNAYQHWADGGSKPGPTAGAKEPSRSRPSMCDISPWHERGAYHHWDPQTFASPEGNYSPSPLRPHIVSTTLAGEVPSTSAGTTGQSVDYPGDRPKRRSVTRAARTERAFRSAPVVLARGVRMPASAETVGSYIPEHETKTILDRTVG